MKKIIATVFFTVIFLVSNLSCFSQSNTTTENKLNISKEVSLEEKLEGTYEIIRTNTKTLDMFTTELLNVIEAKRAENEDVIYVISPNTSVRIFSRAKINSPGFKK